MLRILRPTVRGFLVMGAGVALIACGQDAIGPTAPFSQLDLVVGDGAEAMAGGQLTVHYTLWLYDPRGPESKGRQIQTSIGGQPFAFTLGEGRVIRGWDEGIGGMKVGGRRRLIIPPELAYGSSGAGSDIPPHATLVFEIDLLDVR